MNFFIIRRGNVAVDHVEGLTNIEHRVPVSIGVKRIKL